MLRVLDLKIMALASAAPNTVITATGQMSGLVLSVLMRLILSSSTHDNKMARDLTMETREITLDPRARRLTSMRINLVLLALARGCREILAIRQ
jgi:hypothetical protein